MLLDLVQGPGAFDWRAHFSRTAWSFSGTFGVVNQRLKCCPVLRACRSIMRSGCHRIGDGGHVQSREADGSSRSERS